MISLCLQCCPLDLDATGELVDLICDLEPEKRPDTEFFLCYRRDCPEPALVRAFEERAKRKFGRYKAFMARNFATGHAEGCNALAMSAFMEMSILHSQGICQNEAFLLFEPDCVPMLSDWLDVLSAEWERAKGLGKEAVGHWHQMHSPDHLHLNGNAIFRTDFYNRHPTLHGGPGLQGWDFWHRSAYIALSCDSNYVFQLYGCPTITYEQLEGVLKNGVRPALLHGVKDASARQHIRQKFLACVSA